MKKLSLPSFWKKLTIRDGFREQLRLVLPGIWENDFEKATKKAIMAKVAPYLKKVVVLSENPSGPSDLTLDDVLRLSKWDILALFVKHEATTYLLDNRTTFQNWKMAVSELIQVNGSSCKQVVWSKTALPTVTAVSVINNDNNSDSSSDDDGCSSDDDE